MTILAKALDGLATDKNSLGEESEYLNSECGMRLNELKHLSKKQVSEILALQDNGGISQLANNLGVENKESIESINHCFEVEEYMRNIKEVFVKRFPSIDVSNIIHRKGSGVLSCIDTSNYKAGERIDSSKYNIEPITTFDSLNFSENVDNLQQGEIVGNYSFKIPGLQEESIYIEFSRKSSKKIDLHFKAEVVELRNYIENKNIGELISERSRTLKERFTDGMTGLFNDEYVKEKLNQPNHNYSVIFIDIARFKGINDTYGHTFGDEAIKSVAQFLEKHTSIDDKVCRNGGDEFMILVDNRNQTNIKIIEENLHKIIKEKYEIHMTELEMKNDASFKNPMPITDMVKIEIVLAPAVSVKDNALIAKELIGNANALLNDLKGPEGAADRALGSFKSLKRKARKLAMQMYMQDEDFQRDFFVSLPENQKLFSDIIIQFRHLINQNISIFIKEGYELEEIQGLQDYINMIEATKNFMEKINQLPQK